MTEPAYPLRAGAAAVAATWRSGRRCPGTRPGRAARPTPTTRAPLGPWRSRTPAGWPSTSVGWTAPPARRGRAGGTAGRTRGGDGDAHALGARLHARPAGRGRRAHPCAGGRRRRRGGHAGACRPTTGTPVVELGAGSRRGRRPPRALLDRWTRPSTSCGWWESTGRRRRMAGQLPVPSGRPGRRQPLGLRRLRVGAAGRARGAGAGVRRRLPAGDVRERQQRP